MASGEYMVAEHWAEDAVASEDSPGPARVLLASIRLRQNQGEAARDLLRPFVTEANVHGRLRSDAVLLLGYAALVIGTQDAYDEALALVSRVPTGAKPSDPRVDGIRGCLLIARGQIDAGLSIGRDAFGNPALNRTFISDLACFLAEGEKAKGNMREAGIYAQIAREMGATSRFLARAEGIVPVTGG